MKKLFYKIMAFSMVTLVASCEYKDFCCDHNHLVDVKIAFNSRDTTFSDSTPMRLYLFSKDYDSPLQYDFKNCKESTIKIPVGQYKALCLNTDTKNVVYKNETSYDLFTVSSKTYDNAINGECIAKDPDSLWTATLENVNINLKDLDQMIILQPDLSICSIEIEIKNAVGITNDLMRMHGYISGLAGGLLATMDRAEHTTVTIPFPFYSSSENSIRGNLLFWGHCPDIERNHILYLDFKLNDGSTWRHSIDITQQIHSADDKKHIRIILEDGLPLPERIVDESGGFIPTIEPWDTVFVNIIP